MEIKAMTIAEHIEGYKQSGLNRASYCRTHNISYQTFNYHLKRKNKQESVSRFIHIKPSRSSAAVELHLSNGCFFKFDAGISDELLHRILRLC